jgi:hypothetical protein
MAVADLIGASRDPNFQARIGFLLLKAGLNIANEDPTTDNHANRIAFTNRLLKADVNLGAVTASVVAYNATIQSTIEADPAQLGANVTDGDLEFVVNGLSNILANAYAG